MAAGVIYKATLELLATTTPTLLIPPNPRRNYFLFMNKGTVMVHIKATVSQTDPPVGVTHGIPIQPGGNYEPDQIPLNGFYVVSDGADSSCAFQEAEGS